MASENDLILALEFLTEDDNAVIPADLDIPDFHRPAFRREARRFRLRNAAWVNGAGVQGLGIGAITNDPGGTLALRVYTDRPEASLDNPVATELDVPLVGRVPTHVVEIGELTLESYDDCVRPASPGSSVGHHLLPTYGTFGLLVRTRDEGKICILSNSHVIAQDGLGSVGDVVLQPGAGDGGVLRVHEVAKLTRWVPYDLSIDGFDNKIDAAIAEVTGDATDEIRNFGRASGVSYDITPGMMVQKVGRTTEHTWGSVFDRHAKLYLNHPVHKAQPKVRFRNQVMCTRFTSPGDSGAAVLNDRKEVVGLHVAGSLNTSIFNRIEYVFEELDIELA